MNNDFTYLNFSGDTKSINEIVAKIDDQANTFDCMCISKGIGFGTNYPNDHLIYCMISEGWVSVRIPFKIIDGVLRKCGRTEKISSKLNAIEQII